MHKQNCWEIKNCGREAGGSKEKELGVCPATENIKYNGINSGINGGRYCWAIAGTLCGGIVQGEFAKKKGACIICEFYQQVRKEEGDNFLMLDM
ncbi:MAG: hypothetical protein OEZ22_14970 [Spirochaetia bacterium]|nr:hypothetical protein [Spirochaetia bacterium]